MSLLDGNQVQISCQGDNKTVFVCGNYILPMRQETENRVVATVAEEALEEDTVYIYDIGNLTVSELRLGDY